MIGQLRTAHPEDPPRVAYALTSLGRTLLEPIAACRAWAEKHLTELLTARAPLEDPRERG